MRHHFQKLSKEVRGQSSGVDTMLNKLTSGLDFQGQALTLRSERQKLLASNIANADTPGFLARDVNFNQALREATGEIQKKQSLVISSSGHRGLEASSNTLSNHLTYALPGQLSPDGNSVDMDRERASMVDNSIKYEATLRFINSSVKTMLEAIKGQ
jgi:flagellar basal-body rod protein FlgB